MDTNLIDSCKVINDEYLKYQRFTGGSELVFLKIIISRNFDIVLINLRTEQEANGELAWDEGDVSTLSWGLKELSGQFSELYAWLGAIQELVYSKEENVLDKSLRAVSSFEIKSAHVSFGLFFRLSTKKRKRKTFKIKLQN